MQPCDGDSLAVGRLGVAETSPVLDAGSQYGRYRGEMQDETNLQVGRILLKMVRSHIVTTQNTQCTTEYKQ
jgi:hypothetical protein